MRPTTSEKSAVLPSAASAAATSWIGTGACVVVAVLAFLMGFHKLDNFDTWWHLAAGRWIAVHHAIPHTDTLSHTVRDHPWINVQWAFDLTLYLLHSRGGPALLCLSGAIVFVAAVAVIMRLVAIRAGSTVAALLGLLVVITTQERVTVRPELLSFLLLAAVLFVLARSLETGPEPGRAEGRGVFLLVPLMMLWANVHALFVLGEFAIVCALVQAYWTKDAGNTAASFRRLLIWSAAALMSVVINPYGLTGVLFPLKLVSRINGSSPVFQTVAEFGSPFAAGAAGISIVAYKVMLVIGAMLAAVALVVSMRAPRGSEDRSDRQFDWGGLIFFVGLALLAAAARRNVALFAIGGAPFMARCVEIISSARPRVRARALRLAPIASAIVVIVAALVGATVVTGSFYRFDNDPREFGAGVIEGTFPIRAAAFVRAAALPPSLYNDMASGAYLTWDDPLGGGVFVDSRLEVYDTPFITEYVTALSDPVRWQADADRYGVQTAIIFHRFEPDRLLVGRLFHDKAWSLVYADEVAAVFVRTAGNDAALKRAASIRTEWNDRTDAWLARPVQKGFYAAGRVEGTRAYARFLATIGFNEPAVAAYLKLLDLGVSATEEVERRLLVARYFASSGRLPQAQEQARRILAIDPANTEALALLQR